MNPFAGGGEEKTFFGKHLLDGWLSPRRKPRHWTYSRMKEKQIAKRRQRNKIARRSRRINMLRSKG